MPVIDRQGREVAFGAGIILLLVGIGLAIFFLEPFIESLRHQDELIAVLPEAPKLARGADVWVAGKHVGTVTQVAFMPFHGDSTARIAVHIRFPHEVHYLIRRDSHIRITSARLIGEPVIDISPGSPSSPLIPHGDTLYMDSQIATLASLDEKALIIAAAMDSALTGVKKMAGPLRTRMASLAPVMHNMSAAQTQLAAIMEALQNGPAMQMMASGRFSRSMASLQKTASQLGPAFAQAQANMKTVTGGTGGAGSSMQQMQANAERLSAAIDQMQKLMQEQNGTMYRMSADSALLKTLHTTKAQLDSLIMEARKHPLKFVM
jgi:ABC-type transporter Mla subunit MlaD